MFSLLDEEVLLDIVRIRRVSSHYYLFNKYLTCLGVHGVTRLISSSSFTDHLLSFFAFMSNHFFFAFQLNSQKVLSSKLGPVYHKVRKLRFSGRVAE